VDRHRGPNITATLVSSRKQAEGDVARPPLALACACSADRFAKVLLRLSKLSTRSNQGRKQSPRAGVFEFGKGPTKLVGACEGPVPRVGLGSLLIIRLITEIFL
jgi:hypothetical protein